MNTGINAPDGFASLFVDEKNSAMVAASVLGFKQVFYRFALR
jgi:hypothetical protein